MHVVTDLMDDYHQGRLDIDFNFGGWLDAHVSTNSIAAGAGGGLVIESVAGSHVHVVIANSTFTNNTFHNGGGGLVIPVVLTAQLLLLITHLWTTMFTI